MSGRRVIIDTDIGTDPDDAIALAYAVGGTSLDVVAVTVSGSKVDFRVALARHLLDRCGCADIPVYAGAAVPLTTGRQLYEFGIEGTTEPLGDGTASAGDAIEHLIAASREGSGTEVIALGTLTNLALALGRDPARLDGFGPVWVMGGHLDEACVRGTPLTWGWDYNLCGDPDAAVAVLSSALDLRFVPIETTFTLELTETDVAALRPSDRPLLELLVDQLDRWRPVQHMLLTKLAGAPDDRVHDIVDFLHDPLTVLAAADATIGRWDDVRVVATSIDGVFRTVASTDASVPTRAVLRDIDVAQAKGQILDSVGQLARTVTR